MFSASWWFNDIQAIGWSNIAGLPPTFWLLILMLLISLVVSVFTTVLLLAFWLTSNRNGNPNLWTAYVWSTSMVLTELLRSLAFSGIVRADGMPIEPTWNLYAIAQLAPTLGVTTLGRTLGFWGVSFFAYLIMALVSIAVMAAVQRNTRRLITTSALSFLLIVTVSAGSFVYIRVTDTYNTKVIAVADNQAHNNYLSTLIMELEQDRFPIPTYVVLPEYSNLINPNGNAISFSFNQDFRDEYQNTLRDKQVYLVATEDVTRGPNKHAQTYLLDNQLQPLHTVGKTFLIPGGEYTPPWIKKLLTTVDKNPILSFTHSKERFALHETTGSSTASGIPVHISACSAVLLPYSYQAAVNNGAVVLAINVSLEQFVNAPEYEFYASRFSQFTSTSLRRPLVVGVRGGDAKIYGENGEVLAQTTAEDITAEQSITTSNGKTVYALLGDFWIMSLLTVPFVILVGIRLYSVTKQTSKTFARKNRKRAAQSKK